MKCEQCGKETPVPSWAKQKRFCSDKCRNTFHNRERAQALEAYKHMKAQQQKVEDL